MGRKILSVFMAIAVAVSLSACQAGDTGQAPPLSEVVVGETGSEVTTNVEVEMQASETTENYDPYDYPIYPLPEGWTFEKICGLVEIDGKAIPFPCTVEDMEKLSDHILIGKADEIYNYCDIYYDDINIGTLELDNDSQAIKMFMLTLADDEGFEKSFEKITFAGYTYNQADKIHSFMDNNFEKSMEFGTDYKHTYFIWEENNTTLELRIVQNDVGIKTVYIEMEANYNE